MEELHAKFCGVPDHDRMCMHKLTGMIAHHGATFIDVDRANKARFGWMLHSLHLPRYSIIVRHVTGSGSWVLRDIQAADFTDAVRRAGRLHADAWRSGNDHNE